MDGLKRIDGVKVVLKPYPCNQDDLEYQIAQAGFDWVRAQPKSNTAALREACMEYAARNYRAKDRSIAANTLKNPRAHGLEVGYFDKHEREVEYTGTFRARVTESGQVQTDDPSVNLVELQTMYDHAKGMLTLSSVRQVAEQILAACDGQKILTDLWWLPDEASLNRWLLAASALRICGTESYAIQCPLDDPETVRLVLDTIRERVIKAAQKLEQDVRENKLGDDALFRREMEACNLRRQLQHYEQTLGQELGDIREAVAKADQAISAARSIQQQKTVFEGVFA